MIVVTNSFCKIRAKRLAKLNSGSQQSSSTSLNSKATEPAIQSPVPPKSESTVLPSPPSLNSAELVAKRQKQSTPSQETIASWINKSFEHILQVTLDSERENSQLIFLEQTFTELVEENQDPIFNKDLTDRVIIERLSEIGVDNPFRYLKDSWTKNQQERRIISQKDALREEKLDILNEIDRLTSSYGLVSFQIPDMFINGDVYVFLRDIISNENSYSDFLIQIINRSNEEGTILEFLNIFIPHLSKLI